eukprot:gb/GECG01006048.1/.p1 GENE.gb/GECG01006048.1/~~gb/GECG01006048.1/.p1  ORF type:complete len:125 (+),score=6.87 gb/GECG01006048.1/:1-375(+)
MRCTWALRLRSALREDRKQSAEVEFLVGSSTTLLAFLLEPSPDVPWDCPLPLVGTFVSESSSLSHVGTFSVFFGTRTLFLRCDSRSDNVKKSMSLPTPFKHPLRREALQFDKPGNLIMLISSRE